MLSISLFTELGLLLLSQKCVAVTLFLLNAYTHSALVLDMQFTYPTLA